MEDQVIGMDKQTKVVPIKIVDSLPPFNVPVSAKWHYLSAFVYFMVANAIACAYGAISMVVTFLDRVGLLGYNGNSHVRWNKVCDVFDKFCHQVAASIILSLLGSLAFLLLIVILPILRFHRRT
ncbi:unnamed protein product [Vicia faba]|uniref:CASP-like protein n=1 Tax=Vicia faba TaxID=3906 RepID=A0AAV1AJS9_VICFA|nr:unnamed protein product [Vicia faba]